VKQFIITEMLALIGAVVLIIVIAVIAASLSSPPPTPAPLRIGTVHSGWPFSDPSLNRQYAGDPVYQLSPGRR
jgi:hypothetical protein